MLKDILNNHWHSYRYIDQGIIVAHRGLIRKNASFMHKWKENNVEYDFCLKCGVLKSDIAWGGIKCPVETKAYDRLPRLEHNFEIVTLTRSYAASWVLSPKGIAGTTSAPPQVERWNVEMCVKCGLIPEAEFKTFRIDKKTKCAYLTEGKRGVSKRRIPCNFTDEEWLIQDILT